MEQNLTVSVVSFEASPWAYIAADHIDAWIALAGKDILSENSEDRRNRIYKIITKVAPSTPQKVDS